MADSPVQPQNRAVFLSYAREDADAARRIADALRGFGVEVWFDQNELRGGDVWDQKIRGQIKACTLFVPVISSATQSRDEAYFRLEWKLADDRTHLMAPGKAFILPVVIDDTPETVKTVPDSFARAQWTRLPGGVPTPQFVERVSQLLQTPARLAAGPGTPTMSSAPGSSAPVRKSGIPVWAWGAAAAVVVGVAVALFIALKPKAPPPSVSMSAAVAKPEAPKVDDKSIAVLPFRNMSADASNAYFCDGVQEDILTQLANIGALRVISRTSVMQYRDSAKPIREIAKELGCAYVLEGSVQRAGDRVRVTGQLINALTDEHLWAKNYDRDLTDIFAIQSELAREISSSLSAVLTPAESTRLTKLPTKVPAAYDLVLRARALRGELGNTSEQTGQSESLLSSATQLDPLYADAWGELSYTRLTAYFWNHDHSQAQLDRAKEALDRAVKLSPDDPGVIMGVGNYYYYGFRDYDRARKEYERVAAMLPNNAGVIAALGYIARRQGNWAEAIRNLTHAFELDPRNLALARDLSLMFRNLKRYDDARRYARAMIGLAKDPADGESELAWIDFRESGSVASVEAQIALLAVKAAPGSKEEAELIRSRSGIAWTTGNTADWLQLRLAHPPAVFEESQREYDESLGAVLAIAGRMDEARPRLERALTALQAEIALTPENYDLWVSLADIQVFLGNSEEAIAAIDKAVELLPESRDALNGPIVANERAWILWFAGKHDEALKEIARLVRTPWGLNVNVMRLSLQWAPLRKDPRFMAIINDPKNNEPLF